MTEKDLLEGHADDARIALTWLTRLRWLAVVGQVAAVGVTVTLLGLRPPIGVVVAAVSVTAVSNLAVWAWVTAGRRRPPGWVVPALLVLDVGLLTVLLAVTGGSDNPFRVLYLVHVAMAVVLLRQAWAWGVVALAGLGYATLFLWHLPLYPQGRALPARVAAIGDWLGVLLVGALIAYFIGRVTRALRRREAELAAERDRAGRNERLASLTTLAAGAAHELGSPLGTIAVVSRELQRTLERHSDPEAAEDAALIRQEVDRCRDILNRMRVDILEEGDEEAGVEGVSAQVSAADAGRTGGVIDLVLADLGEAHASRLTIELEPSLPMPAAPATVVRQSLVVLLRNALDATADGGVPVRLTARVVSDDVSTAAIGRRSVVFEVLDAGTGMDESVRRRAGEPFFTTKPPGSGMGLGLFLVRLAAEKYDGRFTLESRPGRGTRATLRLPARTETSTPTPTPTPTPTRTSGGTPDPPPGARVTTGSAPQAIPVASAKAASVAGGGPMVL